jgi:hypothetical protein
MTIRFRPSLTKAQLHEIGQRRDPADIPALLWEIARLRSVAICADQLLSSSDASGIIGRQLRRELDGCECVLEMKQLRADIFTKG